MFNDKHVELNILYKILGQGRIQSRKFIMEVELSILVTLEHKHKVIGPPNL